VAAERVEALIEASFPHCASCKSTRGTVGAVTPIRGIVIGIESITPPDVDKERPMSLGTILLIVLILILIGVLPAWPHARSWGYAPGGIVGVVLLIVIVLLLMGRL
jgi:hypothetical protein